MIYEVFNGEFTEEKRNLKEVIKYIQEDIPTHYTITKLTADRSGDLWSKYELEIESVKVRLKKKE